jgi:LmbE family N-acetylglucosaminyl deacetylase
MNRRIMVIAAHPDDEALGCGGTITRHAAAGDVVRVLFLADGVSSREAADRAPELRARKTAAAKACAIMGTEAPVHLDFSDNRLDTLAMLDIVQAVEREAAAFRPDTVYTHHAGDLNVDHRICHQAVLTAFRPMPGQTVKSIYGFEVCSSTEWAFGGTGPIFVPTRFVDIAAHLKAKSDALRAYDMEMRAFPHARSYEAVEALAAWRGATVGCRAAEAFTVIRDII